MIIVGFIVFAAAVAAAAVLIGQNRNAAVDVHALGHTWSVHLYWVFVAGFVVPLVALIGLAWLRGGAVRSRRRRRERAEMLAEYERLSARERVRNPAQSEFFSGETAVDGPMS